MIVQLRNTTIHTHKQVH